MSTLKLKVTVNETRQRVITHEIDAEDFIEWNGGVKAISSDILEEYIMSSRDPDKDLSIPAADLTDWEIDFVEVDRDV